MYWVQIKQKRKLASIYVKYKETYKKNESSLGFLLVEAYKAPSPCALGDKEARGTGSIPPLLTYKNHRHVYLCRS